MGRLYTAAAIVSLLASFFEAPYFHLHGNPATDHVRKHHHSKDLTVHFHFSIPQHQADGLPAMQSRAENSDNDAIFLVQASSLARLFPLPAFLPGGISRLHLPEPAGNFSLLHAHHSHDPPLAPSISPRPPPA